MSAPINEDRLIELEQQAAIALRRLFGAKRGTVRVAEQGDIAGIEAMCRLEREISTEFNRAMSAASVLGQDAIDKAREPTPDATEAERLANRRHLWWVRLDIACEQVERAGALAADVRAAIKANDVDAYRVAWEMFCIGMKEMQTSFERASALEEELNQIDREPEGQS